MVLTSVKWSICAHPELRKAGTLLVDGGGGGGAGSLGGGGWTGRGAEEVLADPIADHPPGFVGGLGRDAAEPTVAQPPDLKPLDVLEVATGVVDAAGAMLLKPELLQPPLPPALTVVAAASGVVLVNLIPCTLAIFLSSFSSRLRSFSCRTDALSFPTRAAARRSFSRTL